MTRRKILLTLAAATFVGCGYADVPVTPDETDPTAEEHGPFSSDQATLLDFEFDGELVTRGFSSARSQIDAQMLYTIGHLNTHRSVGRLDKVSITNISSAPQADGTTKVTYRAKLPVAWGSKTNLPATYEFRLPRDVSFDGLESFTNKYKTSCVDFGAHDVDSGSMWYYYRPLSSGCAITAAELSRVTARVTRSSENTTGKYPEYHKVWEDNVLNVVSIFGKYEDGATTSSDAGIAAFNAFIRAIKTELRAFSVTTVPALVPDAPGISTPDITFTAVLPDGKKIVITALLVDNVRTAGAAFDARYTALSTTADMISYNGHAGLGQNVRALARKGRFVAGKYLVLFMNGCDTFAYVDGSLAQTRAAINPDDPTGTKYMEIVTNGMPAFFSSMPNATLALVRGLSKFQTPMTYEQIFKNVDRSQVVVVTGEQDNVFTPGGTTFKGLRESGAVTRNQELKYQTMVAPAGTYSVRLAHDPALPGGDADLYVKVGAQPTRTSYDCRPYIGGSAEECRVTLTAPATIFISVFGYASSSSAFVVTADAANL